MYVKVATLPSVVRAALASVNYRKPDISVQAKDVARLSVSSGNGYQGFVVAVNLSTGETKTTMGSWGGANMFNPSNPVDLDDRAHPIPENTVVIIGQRGGTGGKTSASIIANPATLAPMLPAAPADMSDFERTILRAFEELTSAGRKIEFERMRVDAMYIGGDTIPVTAAAAFDKKLAAALDSLVARGYVKRSSNGAMSITTEGKNNCK